MKRILLFGVFLLLIFPFASADEKARNITHLVLLDNSGSIKRWFMQDQSFVQRLAQDYLRSSEVFRDGDEIIIRSFNNAFRIGEEVEFRANDPDRICVFTEQENGSCLNPSTREELLKQFKEGFRATWEDTDLKEALELALLDIDVFAGRKEGIIIWILSDNRQDLGQEAPLQETGILPILEFYEYLYDNDAIRYSYFFPIIRDPGAPERNLVCYGMLYHEAGSKLFEGEAKAVTSRIKAAGKALAALTEGRYDHISPILCKPRRDEPLVLDQKIGFQSDQLDVHGLNVNDEIVFTGLEEGEGFNGRLYVQFTSRFKYWQIDNALLKDPVLFFESYPSQLLKEPEQSRCKIAPREITVGPEETTTRKYRLLLRRGTEDLFVPRVGRFSLKSFLPGARENLHGRLRFAVLIDVNSQMRLKYEGMEKDIENVKMLPAIKDFMYPQTDGSSKIYERTFEYPVRFEVNFAPWRAVTFFAFMVFMLIGLSLILLLALSKMAGVWMTADSSKKFRLHFFRKEEVRVGKQKLGHLSYVPGCGAKFVADPLSRLTGNTRRRKLQLGENSIEVYMKDVKHKLKVFINPKKAKKVGKKTPRKRY